VSERRIRILVSVLGLDQHEAGALAVAKLLRDAGIEVIYAGRFAMPETIVRIAVDEDADAVGISCHSWEFLHYAEELAEKLHAQSPPIPIAIGGSIVTAADREEVLAKGIDAALLPTARNEEVVEAMLELARHREASAACSPGR
jgi:methylmalonyl-CoA mutase C-terminal domain/subunit